MLMHEEPMHWHRTDEDDTGDSLVVMQTLDGRTDLFRVLPCACDDMHLHRESCFHIPNVLVQGALQGREGVFAKQQCHLVLPGAR